MNIAAAKTDAQSFAKILAEHTVLTFDDIERVLLEAEVTPEPAISFDDTNDACKIGSPSNRFQKMR